MVACYRYLVEHDLWCNFDNFISCLLVLLYISNMQFQMADVWLYSFVCGVRRVLWSLTYQKCIYAVVAVSGGAAVAAVVGRLWVTVASVPYLVQLAYGVYKNEPRRRVCVCCDAHNSYVSSEITKLPTTSLSFSINLVPILYVYWEHIWIYWILWSIDRSIDRSSYRILHGMRVPQMHTTHSKYSRLNDATDSVHKSFARKEKKNIN